jgi:hypothetical protein
LIVESDRLWPPIRIALNFVSQAFFIREYQSIVRDSDWTIFYYVGAGVVATHVDEQNPGLKMDCLAGRIGFFPFVIKSVKLLGIARKVAEASEVHLACDHP